MGNAKKALRLTADALTLRWYAREGVAAGTYRGRHVLLYPQNGANSQAIVAVLCADGNIPAPDVAFTGWQAAKKGRCYAFLRNLPMERPKTSAEQTATLLDRVIGYLEAHGAPDCDELGRTGSIDVYRADNGWHLLTEESAETVRVHLASDRNAEAERVERPLPGLVGALVCGLGASVLVFLLGLLGFVSTMLSAVFGAALVVGYKWKGVKLSLPSALVVTALGTALSYGTFRLVKAVQYARGWAVSFTDALCYAPQLARDGGVYETYRSDLLMMVGIGLLASALFCFYELHDSRTRFSVYRIGEKP